MPNSRTASPEVSAVETGAGREAFPLVMHIGPASLPEDR
jgi:hypothetical protein